VVLPGVVAEDADGQRSHVLEVSAGAGVRDVLDALCVRHPRVGRRIRDETGALRRHVNLFVDGEDVRRNGGVDAVVPDGAVLLVLPNVSGG